MNWQQFRSDDYGFGMLVPAGVAVSGRDKGDGWGEIEANLGGGVTIRGMARLGPPAGPEEIEAFGMEYTGVPANYWTKRDEGSNTNGWRWFRTYEARRGNDLVFAMLGVGPRGSYFVTVKTTAQDFTANQALYMQWYNSLTVF